MKQIFGYVDSYPPIFEVISEHYPTVGEVIYHKFGTLDAVSYTVNSVVKIYLYGTDGKETTLELRIAVTKN